MSELYNKMQESVKGFASVEYLEHGAAVFTFDNNDNCTGGFFVPVPKVKNHRDPKTGKVFSCIVDDNGNIIKRMDEIERYVDLKDEEQKTEHNANVVASFMEHCKEKGLDIPDRFFETYFKA